MKNLQKILSLVLIIMLLSLSGCKNTEQSASTTIDYQEKIDSFVSSDLNTFELIVGDEHKPIAAEWLKVGDGDVYSDNTDVVTVDSYGKVTAVGEGSTFVVIIAPDHVMFEVYRYDVYGAIPEADLSRLSEIETDIDLAYEIEHFNSTSFNTYELKVGEMHTPRASVWLNGGRGTCFSTDDSVVSIAENGNVTAVGNGTAYVLIDSGMGDMYDVYMYKVKGN